jgi:hypothetical protein
MKSNLFNTANFQKAAIDYFYLLDRKYPQKGTLKLVGDRYKLTGDQRTVLYRGISSKSRADNRKMRLSQTLHNKILIIDGYNVLFTILNYRLGKPVFISNDGILRDAGSLHGKLRKDEVFYECITLLFDFLIPAKTKHLEIFLDSPVSHSANHKYTIEQKLADHSVRSSCRLVKSPDFEIKQYSEGVICTSDTAIINKTGNFIADLPRLVLEKNFSCNFLHIQDILNPANT